MAFCQEVQFLAVFGNDPRIVKLGFKEVARDKGCIISSPACAQLGRKFLGEYKGRAEGSVILDLRREVGENGKDRY